MTPFYKSKAGAVLKLLGLKHQPRSGLQKYRLLFSVKKVLKKRTPVTGYGCRVVGGTSDV